MKRNKQLEIPEWWQSIKKFQSHAKIAQIEWKNSMQNWIKNYFNEIFLPSLSSDCLMSSTSIPILLPSPLWFIFSFSDTGNEDFCRDKFDCTTHEHSAIDDACGHFIEKFQYPWGEKLRNFFFFLPAWLFSLSHNQFFIATGSDDLIHALGCAL